MRVSQWSVMANDCIGHPFITLYFHPLSTTLSINLHIYNVGQISA